MAMRKLRDTPRLNLGDFPELNDKAISARVHIGRQVLEDLHAVSTDPFLSLNVVLNTALYVALVYKKELKDRLDEISRQRARPVGGAPEDRIDPTEHLCEPDYSNGFMAE